MGRNVFTFCYAVGFVFIILKLTGVVKWSWLWVLSPLWIAFLVFGIIIIGLVIYCKIKENKSYKGDRLKW